MAEYPGTEGERRVAPDKLARDVTRIFAACGMAETDAALLAGRSPPPTSAASIPTARYGCPSMSTNWSAAA